MTRPLTAPERAVLDHLLALPDPRSTRARSFVDEVRVAGACGCGCDTVDLAVAGLEAPATRSSPLTEALDAEGGRTVMVFTDSVTGAPTCLEVFWAENEPATLPAATSLGAPSVWD